ncbi:MAG: hypothetical protein FWG93_02740 [Oscillospiraceae bacterium]|nr:hypothetical protein [Oscillospiraceae bacterium]
MRKTIHILFLAAFLAVLAAMPVLTLLMPPETVSPYEFRALQPMPDFSAEALRSGAYFAQWEGFYTDHLFARDGIIRAHVLLEQSLLRRRVINDVFAADGHVLPVIPFEPPIEDIPGQAKQAAERVARVSEAVASYGGAFLFVGLPSQTTAFLELYPDGVFGNAPNQTRINPAFFAALDELGVPCADMASAFAEDGAPSAAAYRPYYLRADHHLTLSGALRMAEAIAGALEEAYGIRLNAPSADDLVISALPNEVLGSRGRRLFGLSPVEDRLEVFEFRRPVPFRRADNGAVSESAVLKLPRTPEEFTSYSVYMGGDVAETVIQTDRAGLPRALIYGDSHTNILEALLYPCFDEQRSLDLRHYTETGILSYIERHRPDIVILVRDDRSYLGEDGNGKVEP